MAFRLDASVSSPSSPISDANGNFVNAINLLTGTSKKKQKTPNHTTHPHTPSEGRKCPGVARPRSLLQSPHSCKLCTLIYFSLFSSSATLPLWNRLLVEGPFFSLFCSHNDIPPKILPEPFCRGASNGAPSVPHYFNISSLPTSPSSLISSVHDPAPVTT